MEQNKKIEFDVISGDDILIKEVIKNYNRTYNTNFEIVNFIYDEVVFSRIRATNYKVSDLFELGSQFGVYCQYKRQNGEIEW